MDFTPLTDKFAAPRWPAEYELAVVRDAFKLETLLLVGAVVQYAACHFLGPRAAIPAIAFLTYKILDFTAMVLGLKRNPFEDGVVQQKFSAQIPDAHGHYGNKPAAREITVFILGSKTSSVWGNFDPKFMKIGKHFDEMHAELRADPEKYGYYGGNVAFGGERGTSNSLSIIQYWRSPEDLHKYALSPKHRKAWQWWNSTYKDLHTGGIWHEMFQVPAGNYEGIYVDLPPIGLSGVSIPITDKNGEKSWVHPLVDAGKGQLKSSRGRMNRGDGKDLEKEGLTSIYNVD